MRLDESHQNVLHELKIRRRVVKSSLTRIKTLVVKFQTEVRTISGLKFRPKQLPTLHYYICYHTNL